MPLYRAPTFVKRNIVGTRREDDDFSPKAPSKGLSDGARLGLAAGWTVLTTGVGAAIGASRSGQDVVTVEHIPYAETVQVPVGSHQSSGCYQYHYGYDFSSGDWGYHYGYDASCTETVTDYETRNTGRTLVKDITHHSLNYPRTMLQGALLGLGIGAVTGVAGYVLGEAIRKG